MRCKIALCAIFLGFWANVEACTISFGAGIKVYNGTDAPIIVASVQTVYATTFSIGKTPYQDLYLAKDKSTPLDEIILLIVPPGGTGAFDSCKNGGMTYDRCLWIASDPRKLVKAIEDKTIKNVKNDILVQATDNMGQFFVTRDGKKLLASTTGDGDAVVKLREVSDELGLENIGMSFSQKSSIPQAFSDMAVSLAKVKGRSVAFTKELKKFVDIVTQIKTYKEWQTKFATLGIKTEGYKKFKELLTKAAGAGGAHETEIKEACKQYELMALRILAACENDFLGILRDAKYMPCDTSRTIRFCLGSINAPINTFFVGLKKYVLDPMKAVTGYDPIGRKSMDLEGLEFTEGREQALKAVWDRIVKEMQVNWEQAWNGIISRVKASNVGSADVAAAQKSLNVLEKTWLEKLDEHINKRTNADTNGLLEVPLWFKEIMDKKVAELKAALGITD